MTNGYRKPEITVDGITVVIDTLQQTFYLKERPVTGLDIAPSLREDDGYRIYFDRKYPALYYYNGFENLVAFDIGHLVKADPGGVSLLYGLPAKDLPTSDEQLNPYNAAYENRVKNDALPSINAMGKEYRIALCEREFTNVNNPSDRIAWDDLMEFKDGRLFVVWDRKSDELVQDFRKDTDTSTWETVVFGREVNLDPVGYARKEDMSDDAYLDVCPVQYNQKALHLSYDTGKEIRLDRTEEILGKKRVVNKEQAVDKKQKVKNKGLGL